MQKEASMKSKLNHDSLIINFTIENALKMKIVRLGTSKEDHFAISATDTQ